MAAADDVTYIKASIDRYVPDPEGTGNYLKGVFLDRYGGSITNNQKLTAMSEVIRNSFDAFRKSADFPSLGDDPDILTLFTPAGSTQLGRLNEQDPVLSQYAIPGSSSFSIVSLANAVGNISSTFDTGNPSLVPTSLTEVIGNVANIRLDGTEPTTVTSNSLVDKIGKIPITPSITDRSSITASINIAYAHKTPFLLSFCKDTPITSPTTSTFVADMVAILKVILDNSSLDVTGGGGDDMTKCILGASIIASGTPTTRTIIKNICPSLIGSGYTCSAPTTPYASHQECLTGTQNYLTSINIPGSESVFTRALNDPYIKTLVTGEICAQYDS